MCEAAHVEVLRAGVHAWNRWRLEHPGVVPILNDLKVTISERQFGPAQGGPINLSRAELCRAQLDQATLVNANLMGAVLTQADLSDARLDKADLRGARLTRSNLDGAQLDGANLCGADLRLANGLMQAQIDKALGDRRTSLPPHLVRPMGWLHDNQQPPEESVGGTDEAVHKATVDPYAILGVDRGDSLADIRVAWLKQVEDLHAGAPDEADTNAKLKAVNQAYQKLKDLEQRPADMPVGRGASRRAKLGTATLLVAAVALLVLGLESYLARPHGDDTAAARIGPASQTP